MLTRLPWDALWRKKGMVAEKKCEMCKWATPSGEIDYPQINDRWLCHYDPCSDLVSPDYWCRMLR